LPSRNHRPRCRTQRIVAPSASHALVHLQKVLDLLLASTT
jgi:hypothetical protein